MSLVRNANDSYPSFSPFVNPGNPKTNQRKRKALLGVQLPHTAATPDGAAVVATTTICHDGGGCLGFVKSKHSGEIDLPERFQQEQMRFFGGFVICVVFCFFVCFCCVIFSPGKLVLS